MALQFKNGKFRVLMIADTQEGTKVSSDTLNLINAALDRAQPDFVIYSGDQIWGKRKFKGNKDEVKRVLHELSQSFHEKYLLQSVLAITTDRLAFPIPSSLKFINHLIISSAKVRKA